MVVLESGILFSLENVNNLFINVQEEYIPVIKSLAIACKFLALLFLLLNWYNMFFTHTEEKGGILSKGKIMQGVIWVLFVVWSPQVLETTESVLYSLENTISIKESTEQLTPIEAFIMTEEGAKMERNVKDADTSFSMSKLYNYIKMAFDPWSFITLILKGISWVINSLVYPIYLIERAFLLMVCKLLCPIIFALGVFEKYRELAFKWFRVYGAIFISGILLVFVTNVMDSLYQQIAYWLNGASSDVAYLRTSLSTLVAISLTALAKAKLYASSVQLSYKLFNA